MGGSSTTNTTGNSQSINEIPQWVQDAGQANYAFAQQIASQPQQQYQGQMVASVAPQTQQSWDLAANSGNVGLDASNAAQAGYMNTLGQTPQQVTPATDQWHQAALATPTTAAQAKTAQAAAAQQAALAAPTKAAQANLSQLSSTNLGAYMNPYTQDVINKTLPIMNQSLQNQQNALANQANQKNAFGGSRQAITQGVMGAQGAQSEAQMAAQLNQANYAQAQQAGEFDVGQSNQMGEFNAGQLNQVGMYNQGQANQVGMYNAGQSNQVNLGNAQMANQANQFNAGQSNQVGMYNQGQANALAQFNAQQGNQMGMFNDQQINQVNLANQAAGLTQEGLVNSASAGLANVSNQQMKNNIANYGMLASAGATQEQHQQDDINASIAKFNQANNYPTQQLNTLESGLSQTPYNTGTSGSSSSTETKTESNPAAIATGAMGMLGDMFGAGGAGTALLGGSDRRLKTDIRKIGVHHTGIPMYTYRYKGDPKHYPKVAGPMAEDVLKIAPHAVHAINTKGHLAVHMPTLDALNTPPSSPGVARATGMLAPVGMLGRSSPLMTPPTRSFRRPAVVGALGG